MDAREYETLFRLERDFWWYRGLHALVLDQVSSLSHPGAEGTTRMLDAGCGTGGILGRLEGRHELGSRIGIDWSPHALLWARQRARAPLGRASVTSLPFAPGSFDLIISLDVLYHAGVGSDDQALREFARCLRPGGRLILNLPAFESLRSSHDEAIHTARRYRRGPLRRQLTEAGLRIHRLTYWNSTLFPALALVRWGRRVTRGGRPEPEHRKSDVEALPRAVNAALTAVLALERAWLRHFDLPFGLSVLAVAERPRETTGARSPSTGGAP